MQPSEGGPVSSLRVAYRARKCTDAKDLWKDRVRVMHLNRVRYIKGVLQEGVLRSEVCAVKASVAGVNVSCICKSCRDAQDCSFLHRSRVIQDVQRHHASWQLFPCTLAFELPRHVTYAGPVIHVKRILWLGLEKRCQCKKRSSCFFMRGRAWRYWRAAF